MIPNTTNPNAAIQQQQWKTYSDEKLGLSLQYPSTWEVKPKQNRFERMPDLRFVGDGFVFSINKAEGFSLSLFEMAGAAEEELVDKDPTARIIEDINTHQHTIDGEKAAAFLYIHDGTSGLKVTQVMIPKHGLNAYILAFTGDSSNFDQNKAIMDHFFNSIKYLDGISSSNSSNDDDNNNNGQAAQGPSLLPS